MERVNHARKEARETMSELELRLKAAKRKVVGTKQTIKAVTRGEAKAVFMAADAEERLRLEIAQLANDRGIPVITVESMTAIGRACGIDVGSATAAIIED